MSYVDSPGAAGGRLFLLTLLWAVLVVVAVHALDFPGSVSDFVRSSGGGALLDTRPSYSEAEIYERLASYGEAGRENYAFRNLTVDLLLPLSLLPFLVLLMWRALERHSLPGGLRVILLALPFVYVVFDLAENASVLVLLASFPERAPLAAAALPYLTLVKRAGVMLSLAVPLLIFGVSALRSELTAH